jgi:hypothetical protein
LVVSASTLLLVPFIALTAVALLSGTSIERMLFPAKSDVAPYSPAMSSAPAMTRIADMRVGTQPGPPTIRSDLRESTALVLVGEVEPDAPRPSKQVSVQPAVPAKNAVALPRLEAARAHMARLVQTVPAHIPIPNFAQYQETLHLVAKQAQRAIHKASVALVSTIMQVPRGLNRARARFALWFDPKLKRTTDVVVADGKAAWSLVIVGGKTGIDKTSENVARALSDFRTSSVRRTNQIVTGARRVGQGVERARHLAIEHVVNAARRVRSGQLALVKASVMRGTSASTQISSKLQDASAALRSRLKGYSEQTKSRMASIKTRRPLHSRSQANHKTAHYEKRKRRTSRQ